MSHTGENFIRKSQRDINSTHRAVNRPPTSRIIHIGKNFSFLLFLIGKLKLDIKNVKVHLIYYSIITGNILYSRWSKTIHPFAVKHSTAFVYEANAPGSYKQNVVNIFRVGLRLVLFKLNYVFKKLPVKTYRCCLPADHKDTGTMCIVR
mgnify:CR=1 FL=1